MEIETVEIEETIGIEIETGIEDKTAVEIEEEIDQEIVATQTIRLRHNTSFINHNLALNFIILRTSY
jgi:hypothetical protein